MEWNEILQPVLQAIAVALGGVLTGLAVQGLRKLNIDLSIAHQKQVQDAAVVAVLAVEEQAARIAKEAIVKWSASQKANKAVDLVLENVKRADMDDVRRAVDAALPATGLGAAGKVPPTR